MSRHPRLLPLFLALALASAETAAARPEIEPRIESATATGYRAIVSVPLPEIIHGVVFGEPLDEVMIAGASAVEPAGAPQLPAITLILRAPTRTVPAGAAPTGTAPPGAAPRGSVLRVTAHAGNERSLGALRPVPLPRLLSDRDSWGDLSPARLAAYLSDPAYLADSSDRGAPSQADARPVLVRSVSSAEGDEPVVQVTLKPVRWNPRTGEATFVEEVRLDVSWDLPPPAPGGARAAPEAPPRGVAFAPGTRAGAAAYTGPLRVQPSRPWLRLGVVRPGLYVLSPADLQAAGVPTTGI
ncbi:MAG: hypothetical protein HY568_01045, partial [Candidatus Latescibacteria bacterium]|nr:hypothetical protein [Candidatus Latescibacterota bacterium]